ncbi:hypothetical protein GCM10007989_33870 [Devosia pacifica]|uniref:DUF4336 domain-containing protein n=1 Tax=Devosia pacifica TaxID=1335967 RepID=A0A918VXQ0_9HYPH|nr:DUF4336 domain-containing protein [Devosia pacifica]GHA35171.1 hypothetical protein GCM10007989_33870 [Devosia pacifica]
MSEATYQPINTPKQVADDVYIVDGPTIRFGMPWPKMTFPTRMTIVLIDGGLFVHSPTQLTPELKAKVDALGKVRWLLGPNRIHYWWLPDWRAAYPEAVTYLAPRIREQAKGRIDFETVELVGTAALPWYGVLDTLPVHGDFMTEVVFFHRPSRTLILTDLIENFEPHKIRNPITRLLTRLGGVQDPHGQMPRDMRVTFRKHRTALRAAVDTMISWDPQRIILSHGRWYEENGADELRRAFAWLEQ